MGEYVLKGRWHDDYDDGTHPLDWVNSHEILHKFYESNKRVKYGQCWVFAAIYQACCRALGIPSRIITNFDTVIDTNGNLIHDIYVNKYGWPLPKTEGTW